MTRPLTIAIDARWIFPALSGIGRYTLDLGRALVDLGAPHRFVFLFDREALRETHAPALGLDTSPRAVSCLFPHGIFTPASQLRLPRTLRALGADVYHSTNYMMPLAGCGKTARVVTIHDLIPLLFRDHAPRSRKNRLFPVYRRLMHTIARRADAIVAVSEATRHDIATHLGAPADRIHVTAEGVDPRYRPAPGHPTRPSPPELLYVGRRDPYKNLPLLIEAFAQLVREGLDARLRIVGPDDPRYPEARETAARIGGGNRIRWDGYVSDDDLVRAYQEAAVYVLPSRYEGFGLPVLEAMACGTPVVCSNRSSLPEVGGDAAVYADPLEVSVLAERIAGLLTDSEAWARHSQAGLARAATYTWQDAARKTLAVYEQVADAMSKH